MSYLNPLEIPPGMTQYDYWHEVNLRNFAAPINIVAFEHTNDWKHCFYCGNLDHESNLIKCLDGQYRHECCIEFKEEIYKQFKNKSHENK